MTPARFHPDAARELHEQAEYYEQQSPGLGFRFLAEVQAAVQLAEGMPGVGSPYRFGTRRVFPKSFPLSIIYRQMKDELLVLALAPFRRKPTYWRQRQ